MLFSSQISHAIDHFGLEDGVLKMIEAGYPALDMSLFSNIEYVFQDDWQDTANRLRTLAESHGVIFNQAHAPFGGGYENYMKKFVPGFPRIFDFCAALGVQVIVVHPIQEGRYYGHERELFDLNMKFYRSLAPYAKSSGIRIAIENMWQRHPVTHRIVDDVCADPKELAAYYDTLDDPETFTICLDIGHVALCGREPEDAIRIIGHDRLGALHVHDVDYKEDLHTLPGMGKINWDKVCHALAEIDYTGVLTLEADGFLAPYDREFTPVAMKFMADCAAHLADKVDRYRAG